MSVLTKNEIIESINKGELAFEPGLDQFQLQPAAVDIRVGMNFFIPKIWALSESGRKDLNVDHLNNEEKSEVLDHIHLKPGQTFDLLPGEFILISTYEKILIKSGGIISILYPRSSTTRRGISIESGVIDPYYEGSLMIPVFNQTRTQKIKIYPGERIAQLVFHRTESTLSKEESLTHGVARPKYQGVQGYQLDYKFDPHDEINIIRDGNLEQLKKKHLINQNDNEEKNQISLSTERQGNSPRF
ncbi:MAG: dCTP deaminase [Patescibacteria group bacterium]|nr:dCTP deaminase [Patescibacteria group bacterium]